MNVLKISAAALISLSFGTGAGFASSHGNDLVHSRTNNGLIYIMYQTHMTLYTFDEDTKNVSNCNGGCAKNWPPALLPAGSALGESYTLIKRKDGTMQAAFKGQPLYLYKGDKKIGDIKGDGRGGVWHLATPDFSSFLSFQLA